MMLVMILDAQVAVLHALKIVSAGHLELSVKY
jgi:hypothetical protein